jgi:hypothetical protein
MRVICIVLIGFAGRLIAQEFEGDPDKRINEVQVIGTHNSYHVAPHKSVVEALNYTHRPLFEQLDALGIRQIELDVFADKKGGLYANPLAGRMPDVPSHDPDGLLKRPGMKVLHIQDVDYRTTALTLKLALAEVARWSRANPRHFPVMILLELKDESPSPFTVKPEVFGEEQLREVEAEILSIFQKTEILTPKEVKGDFTSLREAIQARGWPTVEAAAGKVMFAMDNEEGLPVLYLEAIPEPLLFVSVGEDHPAAGFFKINDPVVSFDRIQRLVKAGFLVRTRADTPTEYARKNDTSRRDRAFASGAQFISSDYPEPDERLSEYRVSFGKGVVTRPNPVSP